MRFKLDENFGDRVARLFTAAGHDVATVAGERLHGCADRALWETCLREKRCLVTLDLDFADVTRFQPPPDTGVVVVRLPRNPTFLLLAGLVRDLLSALQAETLLGRLWIVEPGRIRIHQSEADDPAAG